MLVGVMAAVCTGQEYYRRAYRAVPVVEVVYRRVARAPQAPVDAAAPLAEEEKKIDGRQWGGYGVYGNYGKHFFNSI